MGTVQVLCLPKNQELQFEVGQWVRILRGMYKGDVGYINELLSWGGVHLLMVSHIWPPDFSTCKRGKWPHSTPPPLTLFDLLAITKTFRVVPKTKGNILMFKGDKFENGLLVKDFGASTVSSMSVFISTEAHSLFLQSQHPTILTNHCSEKFPDSTEWCFSTDEMVQVLSDSDPFEEIGLGYIHNVNLKGIEVEFRSGELAIFERYNILKCIGVGDFVKVVGGMHRGHVGFVDSVSGPDISISETLGEEVLYFFHGNY